MGKISRRGLSILLTFMVCCSFIQPAYALSGAIRVHYSDDTRKPTYDYALTYGNNMGYNVYGLKNADNSLVSFQMAQSDVFVIHTSGMGGLIQMGKEQYVQNPRNTYISGTGGNGDTIKSISSFENGSLSNLKLAIFYGMDVGYAGSQYGDICQETINKGAKTAVAWRGVQVIDEANDWNRLFFEKAQTDNIVESFRHADYWLRYTKSEDAAQRMGASNRNEKGNIYGVIHK